MAHQVAAGSSAATEQAQGTKLQTTQYVHQLNSKALALRELLGLPNDYFGSPASFAPGWRGGSSPSRATSVRSSDISSAPPARSSQRANGGPPMSSSAAAAAAAAQAAAAAAAAAAGRTVPQLEYNAVQTAAIEAVQAARGVQAQHPAVNVTSPVLPQLFTSTESTPQRRWSSTNASFAAQLGTLELPQTGSGAAVGGVAGGAPSSTSASAVAHTQTPSPQLPLTALLAAELGMAPEELLTRLGLYEEVPNTPTEPPMQLATLPPQVMQSTGSATPSQSISQPQIPGFTVPFSMYDSNAFGIPAFPAEYMMGYAQAAPAGPAQPSPTGPAQSSPAGPAQPSPAGPPALFPMPHGPISQTMALPGGGYLVSSSIPLLPENQQQGPMSSNQLYLTATAVYPDLQSAKAAGVVDDTAEVAPSADLQSHTFGTTASAPTTMPPPIPMADSSLFASNHFQPASASLQSFQDYPQSALPTTLNTTYPPYLPPTTLPDVTSTFPQTLPAAFPDTLPAGLIATPPPQAATTLPSSSTHLDELFSSMMTPASLLNFTHSELPTAKPSKVSGMTYHAPQVAPPTLTGLFTMGAHCHSMPPTLQSFNYPCPSPATSWPSSIPTLSAFKPYPML